MNALKKNIDHYMEMKNIKMYSHLLVDIAHELGIKGADAYQFAKREKANFSKMLKGERPLKYEYIIPLEKIFGVSLARLIEEDAYKLPVERDNVTFSKGFRYYAALDDPELYAKEFDILLDTEGKTILNNRDEFGKTFLDYVVEYGSKNGVRYFYENYKPRMKLCHNQFEFTNSKGLTWLNIENAMPLVRLIASMDDADMFYSIYDSFYMFITTGKYLRDGCLFCLDEYLELVMDNEKLFNNLFEIKTYEIEQGASENKEPEKDSKTYHLVNPILNNCLRYALRHLPKYRSQAIQILEFGIKHNAHIAEGHDPSDCYVADGLGGIRSSMDEDWLEFAVVTYEDDISDKEIRDLIEKLPKFKDDGRWRK